MIAKCASRLIVATYALLPLALLLSGRDLQAQSVMPPQPEFSVTPPAVVQYQANNQMQVFTPPDLVTHPEEPPLRWGPVNLRPRGFYRFLYGTGLPASGTNHVNSTIQEFSPGFLFGIGDHWTLDYTPTWRFYSNNQFRDTLDHHVKLFGGTSYQDWFFSLSQGFDSSSTTLVETGTQTDLKTYLTSLQASYQFNSKMSLNAGVNQNIISAEQFQSSSEWSTLNWLNYHFWPRLDAGLGAGFGYVDQNAGTDMTYEQLQGRVNWRATDKLSLQLRGGLEVRQFLSGNSGNLVNPVAGGMIQYQPFDVTRLSLSFNRTVASSYFQNQATESTELTGNLNQRLLGKLSLDLSGTYQKTTYVASSSTSTVRDDEYYAFNTKLSCSLLKRGSAGIFYQYSDNSSTLSGFTYSTSQVGFQVGYQF